MCFASQLEVCISFCTVLSNHHTLFTFISWWLSLLGEHFLFMIGDKSQILGWLWSEVKKAKLNCLKYVWDIQIYVLVSSMFGGNKVMLCCLNPTLKGHGEHFSQQASRSSFFFFCITFFKDDFCKVFFSSMKYGGWLECLSTSYCWINLINLQNIPSYFINKCIPKVLSEMHVSF